MRQTYLIFLTFLVVATALLIANYKISFTYDLVTNKGVILQNLPSSYCPREAEVYRSNRIGRSTIVSVANCNTVSISQLNLVNEEEITIKLPKALAFSVTYSDSVDRYLIGLRVGDVTADNVIDKQDEDLIKSSLFSSDFNADADLDGTVTIHDLSLSRINKAIGVSRSDGKDWRL